MSEGIIEKFQRERQTLNDLVMDYAGLGTKRFYSLDSQAYREGALSPKIKELRGLVASFVLRCDDCIKYHVIRCHEEGVTDAEFEEALFIGLLVGGSITIPHQRRAFEAWAALSPNAGASEARTTEPRQSEPLNTGGGDR
jgi:AhpD family alkylhydroperoxidase